MDREYNKEVCQVYDVELDAIFSGDTVRLYVVIYATNIRNDNFHWALLLAPSADLNESDYGVRFHVKQNSWNWKYEEQKVSLMPTFYSRARILVGYIDSVKEAREALKNVPVGTADSSFTCVTWIQSAYQALLEADIVKFSFDWRTIETKAMQYVRHKLEQHRYDSSLRDSAIDSQKIPTYSLVHSLELNP